MLAAGSAACGWLDNRRDAHADGDPRDWGRSLLVTRYLQSGPPTLDLPLHKISRTNLVSNAFNHLCAHTYDTKTTDINPGED